MNHYTHKAFGINRRGVISITLAGLFILFLVLWYVLPSLKLDKMIAEIQEKGEPLDLVELDAWYPRPLVGRNAADVYLRAFKAYVAPATEEATDHLPVVGKAEPPAPGQPVKPEMLAAMEDYLIANATYLDLLHEAATLRPCRFPIDLTQGFNVQIPHLADLRKAGRCLQLEAILAAEQGDARRAVDAVIATFAAADSLRNEPLLISQLVRVAVNGLAVESLEQVFSRTTLSEQALENLAEVIQACEILDAQSTGFMGERCTAINLINLPVRESHPLLQLAGIPQRSRLSRLEFLTGMIEAGNLPPEERLAAAEKWNAYVEDLSFIHILTKILCPALALSTEAFLEDLAVLRTAAAGVAVERYRAANGRLPESLDALVPAYLKEVPQDPYTGNPLLYKKRDRDYVVYSVGLNLTDDGGSAEKEARDALDVAFTVTTETVPSETPQP